MAGVWVFNFFTDEEIGFRKVKSGLFVKSKNKRLQDLLEHICASEWLKNGWLIDEVGSMQFPTKMGGLIPKRKPSKMDGSRSDPFLM